MRLASNCLITAAVLVAGNTAMAAISFTGTAYTQDFNATAGSQVGVTWVNDTGILPGWYAGMSSTTAAGQTGGVPDTFYRTSGSGGTTGIYLWRPNATIPNDVALGSLNTDGNSPGVGSGYLTYGVALTNNTGTTLRQFDLSYVAEKWIHGTINTLDGVAVSYAIDAAGVRDPDGFWHATGLGFTATPVGYATDPITGNETGPNTTALADLILSPESPSGKQGGLFSWGPGQTIFVRWKDTNARYNDRGLAIDDVSFTASSIGVSVAPLVSGTPDVTLVGPDSTRFAVAEVAVDVGENTVGNSVVSFSPGTNRVLVALDLEGDGAAIAAAIAAIGTSPTLDPVFAGGSYDTQFLVNVPGGQLFDLSWDLTGTGVTLNGFAVVPEPTTLAGLALGTLLLRRKR